MTLRDWLRHPLRCLWCIWDGHLHADCRGRWVITDYAREEMARASVHHVIPQDSADAGRAGNGRHCRLEDLNSGGWPTRRVQGARNDDTIDFPAPHWLA